MAVDLTKLGHSCRCEVCGRTGAELLTGLLDAERMSFSFAWRRHDTLYAAFLAMLVGRALDREAPNVRLTSKSLVPLRDEASRLVVEATVPVPLPPYTGERETP